MLKSFRYLLYPFSLVYGAVIWIRNKLFDKHILRSTMFNFPVICVGNLALGGTGKTPMAEYVINLLREKYKVAFLSRGYKRETRGFVIAEENAHARTIGDEPMQIHLKFPEVTVAVAEERIIGIPQLLQEKPDTEVIILDDAFQHREVRAGINILLTEYHNLYTRDFLLPAGKLRDIPGSSHRADIIVVTKCISDLDKSEREDIINELEPLPHQKVYFTKISYGKPYHLFSGEEIVLSRQTKVLLVSGIANPRPLKEALNDFVDHYEVLSYDDHHNYTADDLKEMAIRFEKIKAPEKLILTTEKDAVRLTKFKSEIGHLPFYAIPMQHAFLFEEGGQFENDLEKYIESAKNAAGDGFTAEEPEGA